MGGNKEELGVDRRKRRRDEREGRLHAREGISTGMEEGKQEVGENK